MSVSSKSRLFIYDRRELVILLALASAVALFAFTLGVHLGKFVGPSPKEAQMLEPKAASAQADAVPNRQELTEASKSVSEEADSALSQTLHEEVGRTGIHLETPRQVDLPAEPKQAEAGKTVLETPGEPHAAAAPAPKAAHVVAPEAAQQSEAPNKTVPSGRFTLQVGSHSTMEEARDQIMGLEAAGITPYLRSAEVPGLGVRYRVFVGGFETKEAALSEGLRLQKAQRIPTYFVTKKP